MSSWQNPHSIAGASDASLSNPSQNDTLVFQSATGSWQNTPFTKAAIGLGNVDNTSDVNKPVSTAAQTALNAKLSLSQAMPVIFATSASTIPARASSIPSGYTGKVIFDTADYPTHTGPTDMQVGDRWRRRTS